MCKMVEIVHPFIYFTNVGRGGIIGLLVFEEEFWLSFFFLGGVGLFFYVIF